MIRYIFRCNILIIMILCIIPFHASAQKLTLQQAIGEAIARNPNLMKANHAIKAIKAEKWTTILPENPEVFTEYEGIPRGKKSFSGYGGRKIGISQELEFPLMYFYRGKYNDLEKTSATAEYFIFRNEVVCDVSKSFYRVLMLKEQMELYEEVVELTKSIYSKAQVKVDVGESTSYETMKVRIDLAEAENRLLQVTKDCEFALYELKLLLGRRKEDTIEIQGDFMFTPVPVNLDSLKRAAMQLHPLLREALTQVNQKKLEKKMVWLGLMPNIKVSYFQQNIREITPEEAWGSEIGLSLPVWGFLKNRGRVRAASHNLQAAGWQVETEKRNVLLNVEEAANRLEIAQNRALKYREDILSEVEELVRIAERSYEEGEMGYLEVTEALRTLQRTKAGYYESIYEYLSADADLEKAIGVSLDRELLKSIEEEK
ncbi:MAG: TolC family protein [Candidatus Latescibacteria bacterium]|jgi:outer membrane protein TolC|nr:TolC family protein [Candidatus Latescibacterota bacterium]